MTADLEPRLFPGSSALLISVPHAGVAVPDHIAARFTAAARALPDTDWYVDRLYAWARAAGAGMLIAGASRYVADLNRPPDDEPLYDRATTRLTSGVVPVQTFDGQPVYRDGAEPGPDEITDRIGRWWRPCHEMLQRELERIRSRHGHAVLLDAHSIRQQVPLLFEGCLPDLNLGSDDGRSTAPSLLQSARAALDGAGFSLVVDGRFKGGYITRHYGRPESDLHAVQLELAQSSYMQQAPPRWEAERARELQAVLQRLVTVLQEWNPRGH